MKHWKTRLLALTLVVVAVLAAGALLGNDTAYARPCCSSCDSGLDNCIAGCNGDPACEADCVTYWSTRCYRWCNYAC